MHTDLNRAWRLAESAINDEQLSKLAIVAAGLMEFEDRDARVRLIRGAVGHNDDFDDALGVLFSMAVCELSARRESRDACHVEIRA